MLTGLTTLQRWQLQLKIAGNPDDPDNPASNVDDSNLDSGDGILHPTLASVDSLPNLADRRLRVGESPTAASLPL
jgi:hypothetical protein